MRRGHTLVVGLGQRDRGDDGVGPVVADRVGRLGIRGVDVVDAGEDPTRLLDLWSGYRRVVVVDAVRSGAAPGDVLVRDLATTALPPPPPAASSHSLDLLGTVRLAESLGRMPDKCFLVGVGGADFELGAPLSRKVASGVVEAMWAVCAVVADD